jgi:hypothetical protein
MKVRKEIGKVTSAVRRNIRNERGNEGRKT